jgi:Ca-activated chloride channel family protein
LLLVASVLAVMLLPAQQFYFKGRFTDTAGQGIAFVQLKLKSNDMRYESGSRGEFGIPAPVKGDSVLCFAQGYDTLGVWLQHDDYRVIMLKPNRSEKEKQLRQNRLSSLVAASMEHKGTPARETYGSGESYNELVANPFVPTASLPVTGFAPNNNRASYSNIRRFVENGNRVPPNAVRLEELWNYFQPQLVDPPPAGQDFSMGALLAPCPWNSAHLLLMVNAIAGKLNTEKLPPANLVFLIDNSGSMEPPNRLALLKTGFKMLVNTIRPVDRIAIVTYGGAAGIMLPPTYGSEKQKILDVIDSLEAGGATPGSNGIQLAYELATTNAFADGVNRVILATDGDFNVGLVAEKDLEDLVSRYRYTGVTLSCLGVGMGNYKDSKIEILARLGQGNFAYLDTEEEAQKVMVQELTQNLYASAAQVKVNVQFDPARVKQYRLIGYDNRMEVLNNGATELVGAEMGSGQSMVAMFELEPEGNKEPVGTWGSWKIEYSGGEELREGRKISQVLNLGVSPFDSTPGGFRLAASLAWYGLQLRHGAGQPYTHFEGPEKIAIQLALPKNTLHNGYLKLLDKTRQLYEPPADRKKEKKGWLRKTNAPGG